MEEERWRAHEVELSLAKFSGERRWNVCGWAVPCLSHLIYKTQQKKRRPRERERGLSWGFWIQALWINQWKPGKTICKFSCRARHHGAVHADNDDKKKIWDPISYPLISSSFYFFNLIILFIAPKKCHIILIIFNYKKRVLIKLDSFLVMPIVLITIIIIITLVAIEITSRLHLMVGTILIGEDNGCTG